MIPADPFGLLSLYAERGWALVPVPAGEKRPVTKGWTTAKFCPLDLDLTGNVGIRFGADSGGLVDVDLDCTEALELADIYLPATGAEFGRASKPRSHRLYVADGAVFETFHDPLLPDRKKTILELRSSSATGGAHQTIVPASIADGEQRYWEGDAIEPAVVDHRVLRRACARLAVGCLVMRWISPTAARKPGPDLPGVLWEFDHDLARPAYRWLGIRTPDEPSRYPKPRHELSKQDLDLAEMVHATPNNFDWHGWDDYGLAIYAAARDNGHDLGAAFVIFDDFSAKHPAYDPHETAARWRNFEKYPPSRTGIGKIAKLAYAAGWRPKAGGRHAVATKRPA
jgi:hypothetical protein